MNSHNGHGPLPRAQLRSFFGSVLTAGVRRRAGAPRVLRPPWRPGRTVNANAAELWRRFTTFLPRRLAALAADRDSDSGSAVLLRFGTQTDTRPIRHGRDGPLTAQAVANYIGKYATKTLTAPGLPTRPIRSIADAHRLTCSRHYQQMITTAWQLGGTAGADGQRLRRRRTCSATAATT